MLSIDSVSYRYRNAPEAALHELTLRVPGNSVYGLLGPNGAGKTTLISLLCGGLTASTGRIQIDDQPLAAIRAADVRAIALVPQDYAFYPMLTVRENLDCFAGMLGYGGKARRLRIEHALAFGQLENVVEKRAETLSGGLRRRLNLAIGILGEPRLLLLDEPTVGVDPQSRHFLLEAIAGLPVAGTSVIYTTHYMDEVQAICQRIAILDHGRLLAEGTLDTLCAGLPPEVTLDTQSPLPPKLLDRWQAEALGPLKYRLDLASTAALTLLLDDLAQAGIGINHLACGRPDLAQLFMRLTHRSLRD